MKIVDKKVKAGDTETVIQPEEEAPGEAAQVIDLTELLARSSEERQRQPRRQRNPQPEQKDGTKTKQRTARKAAAKKASAGEQS
jgi:DNA end-binding protein Ku